MWNGEPGKIQKWGHHKKPKWFALMLVGIGIMAVILCSTFFRTGTRILFQ